MPFLLGFVVVVAFCVALFVIVSRKNVALACGEHASISTNSNIKKMGISLLAALLIVGSCASFTKAFADTIDEDKITGDVEINLNFDYTLNSIVVTVTNNAQVDLRGNSVVLFGETYGETSNYYGIFSDFQGDNIVLNLNDPVCKTGATTTFTAVPSDLAPEYYNGFHANGIHTSLDGLRISEGFLNDILSNNEIAHSLLRVELSYDAWNVDFVYDRKSDISGKIYTEVLSKSSCIDGTFVDSTLANKNPLIESPWLSHWNGHENLEFIAWNTKKDGTGETVDAAYLASHPITADTTFYAIFKEKTAGNDAPNADQTDSADSDLNADVADADTQNVVSEQNSEEAVQGDENDADSIDSADFDASAVKED